MKVKKSKIQWTGPTWNPWHGCVKVSPGCKFCYMYRDKERYGRSRNGKPKTMQILQKLLSVFKVLIDGSLQLITCFDIHTVQCSTLFAKWQTINPFYLLIINVFSSKQHSYFIFRLFCIYLFQNFLKAMKIQIYASPKR